MGPVRPTYARREDFPPLTKSYRELSQTVQELGLLVRAPKFYLFTGIALTLAFAGAITASAFIGNSWWQLGIAAVFGILFTQIAFLAHEAAHRQILATGPANDRLARILIGIVGMSYAWWGSKHTRHLANPNRVGKDPDIDVDTISFVEEDAAQSRGLVRWITKRQG